MFFKINCFWSRLIKRKFVKYFYKLTRIHTKGIYSRSSLHYYRYSNEILLYFIGSEQEALLILQQIVFFIETKLFLQICTAKTGIYCCSGIGTHFLGYNLVKNGILLNTAPGLVKKVCAGGIFFKVPLSQLYKYYTKLGFFQIARKTNHIKYVARRCDKLLALGSIDAITRWFGRLWIAIKLYYKITSNTVILYEIFYLLKRCLALTIAHWYKLKSAKKVYVRFGTNLIMDFVSEFKDR